MAIDEKAEGMHYEGISQNDAIEYFVGHLELGKVDAPPSKYHPMHKKKPEGGLISRIFKKTTVDDPEEERHRNAAFRIADLIELSIAVAIIDNRADLILPLDEFRTKLESSIQRGVDYVNAEYWIDYDINYIPTIVNPFFLPIALDWFMEQIEMRDGLDFKLLNVPTHYEDGTIHLRRSSYPSIVRRQRPKLQIVK